MSTIEPWPWNPSPFNPWNPVRFYPPSYAPTHAPVPSVAEQMGVDPISRLAAAIEKLAEALEKQSENNN